MANREAGDVAADSSTLAAVGCLGSINAILLSIRNCPNIFCEIEQIMIPILRRVLIPDFRGILISVHCTMFCTWLYEDFLIITCRTFVICT